MLVNNYTVVIINRKSPLPGRKVLIVHEGYYSNEIYIYHMKSTRILYYDINY